MTLFHIVLVQSYPPIAKLIYQLFFWLTGNLIIWNYQVYNTWCRILRLLGNEINELCDELGIRLYKSITCCFMVNLQKINSE